MISKQGRLAIAVVLALLGPLVGLVAYRVARSAEQERALGRLREDFGERVFALENEIAKHVEAVAAVKALFDSREDVTRAEFRAFTGDLLARHRVIKALEWIPRVPADERGRHEAATRASGMDRYRITELTDSGEVVPAATRDEYYPVHFVEPIEGNELALGLDLSCDKSRKATLLRASETGQPALTDPIELVQDPGLSVGLLLVLPVYQTAEPSEPDGRPGIRGFALGVIRIEELMRQSLPIGRDRGALSMVFELVDDDAGGRPKVMFIGPDPEEIDATADVSQRKAIEIGGQQWHLVGHPRQGFLTGQGAVRGVALAIGTFFGWEALVALGIALASRTRDAVRRKQSRFIRSVLDSVAEGVIVADSKGAFQYVNRAAREVVELKRGELAPEEWSEAFGLFVPGTDEMYPADELPLARAIRGEKVDPEEVYVRNPRVPGGAWLRVSGAPLTDGGGALQGGVVVFRDVSEQKRAEELSRRLSSAVEETADAVFITDRDGNIEYVNDAFETITGYSREQAVGETPRILKSGKQHPDYYANLWAALLKGESFRASVINRRRNGELFHARQTITPLRDREGGKITSFVSLLTDLTEHMIFEEKAIEMRLAAKVQRQTFPQKQPRVSGFDIAGTVSPALETCGDYYDFLQLPDGRLGITIADACGHGVGPALIMAETRAMVRLLARTGRDPAAVLAEVNESLAADLSAGHYVTMILAWLDPRSGELQWANAGHPPGLVLSKSGSVRERLRCTGIPLGLFADRRCGAGQAVVLGPGESLLLMTDGITETESPDGSQLDVGAVIDFVREHRHEPAPEILDRLHRFVGEFAAGQPQKDDLTSVICRRTDESA